MVIQKTDKARPDREVCVLNPDREKIDKYSPIFRAVEIVLQLHQGLLYTRE